jgi:hypothetical protein
VLGIIGTVAAVAGIWSYFATWLNILGVMVPPIGVTAIAMVTGGIAFTALTLLTGSTTAPTDYEAEEPALSGEAV